MFTDRDIEISKRINVKMGKREYDSTHFANDYCTVVRRMNYEYRCEERDRKLAQIPHLIGVLCWCFLYVFAIMEALP